MCTFQLSLLSSITPRNLVSVTSFIVCPFILIEIVSGRSRFVNSIRCVLFRLIISLLAANHSYTLLKSVSVVSIACLSVSALYVTVESSANCVRKNRSEICIMSLIYIKKRSGPRVDPWGTPMFTVFVSEFFPFICTKYFLFLIKFSKNSRNFPLNP